MFITVIKSKMTRFAGNVACAGKCKIIQNFSHKTWIESTVSEAQI
jgi:hypothetical protein